MSSQSLLSPVRSSSRASAPVWSSSRASASARSSSRASAPVRSSSRASASARSSSRASVPARAAADEFAAWLAKYAPVERTIIEAQERRLSRKAARKAAQARKFGALCEATGGCAISWRNWNLSSAEQIRLAGGDVWTLQCLAAYFGRSATRTLNGLRHQLKRPIYYAAENARRRALAAERRAIRKRTTTNSCPTREMILDAWIHLKDSHEATIRFGSLIEDLACYVDSSLRFDENGDICGRNGGVKAWLQENIPVLALRYTTVMRYKALARKLKQIAEIGDPTPAELIAGTGDPMSAEPIVGVGDPTPAELIAGTGDSMLTGQIGGKVAQSEGRSAALAGNEIMVRTNHLSGAPVRNLPGAAGRGMPGARDLPVALVRARAIWREVVNGIRPCPTALVARIDALVDPERVEEATMLAKWRERYANEITERTKNRWWKRLCKKGDAA